LDLGQEVVAFVPEGLVRIAARSEDAAVLVPDDEADGGLEGPMEGMSQAEAVPDDEREIGGLELEMEGFVF